MTGVGATPSKSADDELVAEAAARHLRHIQHASSRPLSDDYELVGLAGEKAASDFFGIPVDMTARPGGDGGVDFKVPFFFRNRIEFISIDVKAARKPFNLIVEEGKCVGRTIYILARYFDETKTAQLLKWEWGWRLLNVPPRDFGYGIKNHAIHERFLRPLVELRRRQVKHCVCKVWQKR